jgi:uncharacterized iron-regulated membrane protein
MNQKIYSWIWKWHFIGGLASLPIIILLSITGIIYLFKEDYEKSDRTALKHVEIADRRISYQEQLQVVSENWDKKPTAMILPSSEGEATEFVSGRFSNKSSLFINPYSGQVNGSVQINQTDMHKVRKLHGELLLGAYGTKIVELTACWMVVLIVTGMYLFWPRDRGLKGLIMVRTHLSKRILFRDLHVVSGFWFSVMLLMVLAGGLPWTDVWGSGFKWAQEQTNTGFTKPWKGFMFKSEINGLAIGLDEMVAKTKTLDLEGEVSIAIPQKPDGIYSISNQTPNVRAIQKFHFDQYSGKQLYHGSWDDIGIMMQSRIWVMAFHQGQFGYWNWLLIIFTAFGLLFISVMALVSYIKRKRKGDWSIPQTPKGLNLGMGIIILIILLGILLPLFGLSVLLIYVIERFLKMRSERL